jgi:tetratricopeptide (TPR) repeat protein
LATLCALTAEGVRTLPAARFRVLGVPVEIRTSFVLLALVLGLQRHTDLLLLPWIVLATIAVLVHEAGHAVAFRAFGIAPTVTLHGGGGATMGSDPGVHRRIILSSAGPLAGLLLGVVAVLAARALPPGPMTRTLLDDVLFTTLGWSLVNLLPVGELDGHGVLKDVVRIAFGHPAVVEIRVIGVCVMIALVAGAIRLGAYDAAFILGFIGIVSATPLDRLAGLRSSGGATPAGALLMQGRSDEALAAADAALSRNPDDTDALLDRATTLRVMTRFDEAEAAFTQLLERRPDMAAARSGRAMVRSALGREAEARADLDALPLDPGSGPAGEISRVIALYVSHRYEEATTLIETRLARPDLDRAERGQMQGMQPLLNEACGRPDVALRQVDAALRDRPDDLVLHEVRALILIGSGRPRDATRSARRALGVAPRNPELLESTGIAERFAGLAGSALPRLLAAAAARPDLPRARAELSACFTQLGRLEEARGALATLPGAAGRDPFVKYAEACLLEATGDRVGAVDRLADAVRIRPGLAGRAAADPLLRRVTGDPDAAATLAPQSVAAT